MEAFVSGRDRSQRHVREMEGEFAQELDEDQRFGDLGEVRINLLGQSVSDLDTPMGVAVLSAVAKFEDQRRKAGLAPSQVRDAWLTIRRLPGLAWGSVNGHSCAGFNLSFLAAAMM